MNSLIIELSHQEIIDTNGGVDPTTKTSLANDLGDFVGTTAAALVCGAKVVSSYVEAAYNKVASWF